MEALREAGALVEPYWDARLRGDRALRLDLYRALRRCGLLGFCFRRKARARLFTVKKKNGLQRLIVDGRQANSQHRPPPTTRLSTPSGLTSLDFSEATLIGNGHGEHDTQTGKVAVQPSAETGDVADCLYNFTIPALSGWFAFDDAFTRGELLSIDIDPGHVYDYDIGEAREIRRGEKVWASFMGVPMGWSWALYIANEIVAFQASKSRPQLRLDEIRDRQPPPQVLPGQPPIGVYVDNILTFGGKLGEAGDRMTKVADRFRDLGGSFVVDNVEKDLCLEGLGLFMDFRQGAKARGKEGLEAVARDSRTSTTTACVRPGFTCLARTGQLPLPALQAGSLKSFRDLQVHH